MYNGNRQPPFFEFAANRLVAGPKPRSTPTMNPTAYDRQIFMPAYLDASL